MYGLRFVYPQKPVYTYRPRTTAIAPQPRRVIPTDLQLHRESRTHRPRNPVFILTNSRNVLVKTHHFILNGSKVFIIYLVKIYSFSLLPVLVDLVNKDYQNVHVSGPPCKRTSMFLPCCSTRVARSLVFDRTFRFLVQGPVDNCVQNRSGGQFYSVFILTSISSLMI